MITLVVSGLGLLYIYLVLKNLKSNDPGTPEMQKIHQFILTGARAYLKRQYKTVFIVLVVIFVLLLPVSIHLAVSFMIGSISSLVSSYIAMVSSTMANVRVTQAAKSSVDKALRIGFKSGMIIGVGVISISTLAVCVLYVMFDFTLLYNLDNP
ncbi:MAG: sodium/proton-translocating pyrophosphatase [Promethearchaeota archaeon]